MSWKLASVLFVLSVSSCQEPPPPIVPLSELPAQIEGGVKLLNAEVPQPDKSLQHIIRHKEEGKLMGAINLLGEWTIPLEERWLHDHWRGGMVASSREEGCGVINYKNEVIAPFENRYLPSISKQSYPTDVDSRYIVSAGGSEQAIKEKRKSRTYDQRGVEVFGDFQRSPDQHWKPYPGSWHRYSEVVSYEVIQHGQTVGHFEDADFLAWVGPLRENRAPIYVARLAVRSTTGTQGKIYYGYVDAQGKLAIPIQFRVDQVFKSEDYGRPDPTIHTEFVKGSAQVRLDGKVVMIDTNGNVLKTIAGKWGPGRNTEGYFYRAEGVYGPDGKMYVQRDTSGKADLTNQRYGFVSDYLWFTNPQDGSTQIYDAKMNLVASLFEDADVYSYTSWQGPRYAGNRTMIATRVHRAHLEVEEGKPTPDRSILESTRLYGANGTPLTDWLPAGYYYDFASGFYWKRFTEPGPVTVYNFVNEVIHSCESCKVKTSDYAGLIKVYHGDEEYKADWVTRAGIQFTGKEHEFQKNLFDLNGQIQAANRPIPTYNRLQAPLDSATIAAAAREVLGL